MPDPRPGPRPRGAPSSARASARATPDRLQRSIAREDQVVEVETAGRPDGGFVVDECAGDRPGVRIGGDLGRVTPSSTLSREMTVSSRSEGRPRRPTARRAARIACRSASGSTATPASRRISRPSAWNVRTRTVAGRDPERRDGRVQALGHLDGGPLVEGDRPDARRAGCPSRSARRPARRASSSCPIRPARCTTPARTAPSPRHAGRERDARGARTTGVDGHPDASLAPALDRHYPVRRHRRSCGRRMVLEHSVNHVDAGRYRSAAPASRGVVWCSSQVPPVQTYRTPLRRRPVPQRIVEVSRDQFFPPFPARSSC